MIQQEKTFFNQVYEIVKCIPKGKVATYGQIARLMGKTKASRAVGYALHANPYPGIVPCHRVVNCEGRLAPGFAFGGQDIQKEMLEAEGVEVKKDYMVDLSIYLWQK